MPIPEKDFYTLDEVAARWECIGFDKSSFLDLATKDLLVFSIYRRDIGTYRQVNEVGDVTSITTVFSFTAENYRRDGIRYLKAEDARRILEAEPGKEVGASGYYLLPTRTRESGTASSNLYLTASDLGVSLTERNRFESEHGYTSFPAGFSRLWSWAKEDNNRAVITWVCTGAAAIVVAGWALVQFIYKCP
ncbi:MAG: hypothetical protein IPN27_00035 [Cellvibrionales bacterium]|nr:hypothetical protein [Cellvibrionales bacterium]